MNHKDICKTVRLSNIPLTFFRLPFYLQVISGYVKSPWNYLFWPPLLLVSSTFEKMWTCVINTFTGHQWLRQISMKLPYALLRKSALKFTKGSKRENSISDYFLLFWFYQNSISVLKTLLSCLSENTLWKVNSESPYKKQGCMKSR